ncbi:MAG: diguanylate cyclase, partial [Vicinamibacterales bacterium]
MDVSSRVLHIGGSAAEARAVRDALLGSSSDLFELEWAETLSEGLQQLGARRIGALLLSLSSPEGVGIDGLAQLHLAAPAIPILVLGLDESDEVATQVIASGAHQYLVLRRLDSYWLPRTVRHAIERKSSEEAFLVERDDARVALDSIGDAVINTDLSGRVVYLNRIAETMTGWSRAEAAGQPIDKVMQLVEGDTHEPAMFPAPDATPSGRAHLVSTYVLIRRDGSESTVERVAAPVRDRRGQTTGTTLVLRDVSASRATAARVSYLASHDVMTGLPNRLLLGDRLARALSLAHRHGRRLAVLFLDIDRFKHVNDSLGHLLGDELLRSVARTLSMCVRSSDTVSRQGGDEFVVVLSELEHVEQAAKGAQTIIKALAHPHHIAGLELHVTVSVGISVYPDDGN